MSQLLVAAFLLGLTVAACSHASSQGLPVQCADIGPCTYHGTTRGHQRKVAYVNGTWVICFANEDGSQIRTSEDGIQWSAPTRFNAMESSSSFTFITRHSRLFIFYTDFKPDSAERQWRSDGLVVREVLIQDGRATLGDEVHPVMIDPQGTDFYICAAAGPDGAFWVQTRHVDRSVPEEQLAQDTRLTQTTLPGRLEKWTVPVVPIPVRAKGSIVPVIVPLPEGKAYSFARTYAEVGSKANRLLGSFFDGIAWQRQPTMLAKMTAVQGDDRRMCAVLDEPTGTVHLVYIDGQGVLRHRHLAPPYATWDPAAAGAGTVLHEAPVCAAVIAIDPHVDPAALHVIYVRELRVGRDKRRRTGDVRLMSFDGEQWQERGPISDPATDDNWYPNVAAHVTEDGKLGVLYLRGTEQDELRARVAIVQVRP